MKKYISTVLFAAALATSAYAQSMEDALRFSGNDYDGTARTVAMGNAFTALGGDVGAVTINPAASAVNNYSQVVITPGVNIVLNTAQGTCLEGEATPFSFGDLNKNRKTRASLPNVGAVITFDTGRNMGVRSVSLGVVANSTRYFLDNAYASGNHYGTSFAGGLAAGATGIDCNNLSGDGAYDKYNWKTVLGWQSGMISNIYPSVDQYIGATEKIVPREGGSTIEVAGELNQNFGRLITGNKYDYVVNLGLNISDWIFIGANLGLTSLSYDYDDYLKESAVNRTDFPVDYGEDGSTYFNYLKYQYGYSASGSGIYGKFGIILAPGRVFRIGLSYQTPTDYTIKESWKCSGETKFADTKFNSSATSPEGNYSYKLVTPGLLDIGVAATFGGIAVVSADYELCHYGNGDRAMMRFKSRGSNLDTSEFEWVNNDIAQGLRASHMLRAGVEVRPIPELAVRAGYNLTSDPHKGMKAFDQSCSFGLGYSSKGSFFADVAVRSLFNHPEYIIPYADYIFDDNDNVVCYTPEIRNVRTMISAMATIGFRF